MSVEVRELIIRTTVSQEPGSSPKQLPGKDDKSSTDAIIRACVEKVMELIRNRNGR